MVKKEGKKSKEKHGNKKIIVGVILLVLVVLSTVVIVSYKNSSKKIINTKTNELEALPKPEITGGDRGELGIDKNINEATIDKYLNRKDAVYRDMRMLEDPGNYEAIGGDRFLSGYIKGFEVVPLPYIIPVTGLPSAVGDTYTGTTLFYNDNGTYIANYKESMDIVEKLFPKNKVIFLMCGGGGYAGMMKNFLVSLGWDENKIYNTGGYWYYKGKNNVNIKKEVDGKVTYDFDKVPYHDIEFDKLTKTENYRAPIVKVTDLKINTTEIKLEEGATFQLNAIVLPNNATNKSLKWSSNNLSVATVTSSGLVKAVGAGAVTITAESNDGKKVTCTVNVNKKTVSTRIKLDDISSDASTFNSHDPLDLFRKYETYNPEDFDDSGELTDAGRERQKKYDELANEAVDIRKNIFNRLVNQKKSFIILFRTKNCDGKPYLVVDGAERVLKQNSYSYLLTYSATTVLDIFNEKGLVNLELNEMMGSIVIVKNGSIYKYVDPNSDALKSDAEVKNWLSKYIEI